MMQPVRMKKRKMFLNVNANGLRVVASGVVVQACQNDLGLIRVGFTTTKKLGNAVVRNRIRRRLREVVRLSQEIPNMSGFDLVFIGRISTKDRPFDKLQSDLKFALCEIKRQYEDKNHDESDV